MIFVNGKPDSGKSYVAAYLALQLGRGIDAHTYYLKLESNTTPEMAMQIFRYLVAQIAHQADKGRHHKWVHDLFVIVDADMLQSPESRFRMFEFSNLCNVLFSQVSLIISVKRYINTMFLVLIDSFTKGSTHDCNTMWPRKFC